MIIIQHITHILEPIAVAGVGVIVAVAVEVGVVVGGVEAVGVVLVMTMMTTMIVRDTIKLKKVYLVFLISRYFF